MEGGKKEILANQISWQHIVFCPDKSNRNIEPVFIVKVKTNFLLFMVTFTTQLSQTEQPRDIISQI